MGFHFHAYRARMINKAYRRGGLPALRKQAHMSPLPTSVGIRRFLASPAGMILARAARNADRPAGRQSSQNQPNEPHREVRRTWH